MEHSVFVEKYRANQIAVNVNKSKVGFLYDKPGLIPQDLLEKQAKFRTLGFGGLVIAFVLFFLMPRWVALGVLAIAIYMFTQAQKNAFRGVIEAALKYPHVYQVAVENQVLLIKEVVQQTDEQRKE